MSAILPHLNASLNGLCAVLLFSGWIAIRGGHIKRHRLLMVSAFIVSVLFLISYLIRFYLTGTHRYPGSGWDRTFYLSVLLTHTVLAAAVPFLAIRTLYLAIHERFAAHRRWARVTFPIWMYVSITGVIVYWMLYHLSA